MGKRRPNEKKARAPKITEFEHEDDPASAGRYERSAAKARAETGLEPVVASDTTAEEKAAQEKAWPIGGQTALESVRARAKPPLPREC